MKTLIRLIEIQFKELLRDPGVLFWGIGFPVLMALGLGIAFSVKQEVVRPVAVVSSHLDLFKDSKVLEPIEVDGNKIERSERFFESPAVGSNHIIFHKTSENQAELLLKRGIVTLVIKDGPEYLFDPRNNEAQLTYLITQSLLENNLSALTTAKVIPYEVPGTRYVDFLLPGLIAMGVMMSSMWGISYGLIERRSKKLLRRLVATPMRRRDYLFSMIFVRVLFGFIESGVLILFGSLFFHFQVFGSWFALILLFICGYWAFSGLSILIASRTTTVEIGTGIINAVTTPMLVVSGIFFSYQHFPSWAKYIIEILPLTIVTDSLRKIMLEGGGVASVQMAMILLLAIGTICFAAGIKIFKWY